ncbi:dihydroxyacetone kinase, N-terminal domain [Streptomyces sp. DvalAA-14]|uniref:dihydroxyacetone kinase subunit DhaK n=1 Tax=unclassified Streptomyces TaxID=2593676 RepID=UPI00081B494B|nr:MULTISPECIES: dihydroxyacetone kinase subunit DhaK [unclassified Streptomyces]MYS23830.1 dihydroxyacetone kinase [Streptomyces sp. SID4948]SCE39170.1 dihydroxyacetone kinase, N-terminal domain [Streptomyces sp. DvalAA-14]
MGLYFANAIDDLVVDALAGFARAHAGMVEWDEPNGYVRSLHTAPSRRVGLVSGGGSGHEPLHIGYVGAGMLDAACPGRIFASPHNHAIFAASRAVAREEGVLHLVKNYTGDKINFGIAAERLARDDIPCARVLIDDDLASESAEVMTGRRGTGATVLVEKILGAAADTGMGLADLTALGTELVARSRSLAVASAAHTAPPTGLPAFDLAAGDIEYGVGIHGERARRTLGGGRPLRELAADMVTALDGSLGLSRGAQVLVLVNGLGAITRMELYAVLNEVTRLLDERGADTVRTLVGDFVTALDMRGFSLTLMLADPATLTYFDAPAHTAAWPRENAVGALQPTNARP